MRRWIALIAVSLATASCSGCDQKNTESAPSGGTAATNEQAAKLQGDGGTLTPSQRFARPDPRTLRIDPNLMNPNADAGAAE